MPPIDVQLLVGLGFLVVVVGCAETTTHLSFLEEAIVALGIAMHGLLRDEFMHC